MCRPEVHASDGSPSATSSQSLLVTCFFLKAVGSNTHGSDSFGNSTALQAHRVPADSRIFRCPEPAVRVQSACLQIQEIPGLSSMFHSRPCQTCASRLVFFEDFSPVTNRILNCASHKSTLTWAAPSTSVVTLILSTCGNRLGLTPLSGGVSSATVRQIEKERF
jgi:hypothetical protein